MNDRRTHASGLEPRAFWTLVTILALVLGLLFWKSISLTMGMNDTMRPLGVIPLTPAEVAAAEASSQADAEAALKALAAITDYQAALWHPLHFKPAVTTARNEQCLACHREILDHKPREASQAGVAANESIAWYQTLDTYQGEQLSFHARHLKTPFATKVMNLKCNFCHQGHDPRDEAPGTHATAGPATFTIRKVVDPSKTCLMCHGKFPGDVMGLGEEPWHLLREGMESPESPNGCLSCHAELFRTVRHRVNYLNAEAIEADAKANADTCFGCHGGRAWYRKSYPYPRHAWPSMDPTIPVWAKDRPTQSAPEHIVNDK